MHEFRVYDANHRKQWERLLGFKITGYSVRMTREFYLKYAGEIGTIQMSACLSMKDKDISSPQPRLQDVPTNDKE